MIRLSENKINQIVNRSIKQVLSEMGTPKQNAFLQKLVGDNRYDDLSVPDASKKIDQLLKKQPVRPMSDKQLAYLKKLAGNGWLKRAKSSVIKLGNLVTQPENYYKIDVRLGSKLIDLMKNEIEFYSCLFRYGPDAVSNQEAQELDDQEYSIECEIREVLGIPRPEVKKEEEPQDLGYTIYSDNEKGGNNTIRPSFCYAHGTLEDDLGSDIFAIDSSFNENMAGEYSIKPGQYKCNFNGKPCTLYVGGKRRGLDGLVCYDDDQEAKEYIKQYINVTESRIRSGLRLTESDLNRIVRRSVNSVLNKKNWL